MFYSTTVESAERVDGLAPAVDLDRQIKAKNSNTLINAVSKYITVYY